MGHLPWGIPHGGTCRSYELPRLLDWGFTNLEDGIRAIQGSWVYRFANLETVAVRQRWSIEDLYTSVRGVYLQNLNANRTLINVNKR